jgi:hypothetical protein
LAKVTVAIFVVIIKSEIVMRKSAIVRIEIDPLSSRTLLESFSKVLT